MKRNNKKKGFTLVELLVVIAILAILASVTVVGYTGFTKKAKQSNAETEAAQVTEILRLSLLDGVEDNGAGLKVVVAANGDVYVSEALKTEPGAATINAENLAVLFPDLAALDGAGTITGAVATGATTASGEAYNGMFLLTSITYTNTAYGEGIEIPAAKFAK